MSDYDNYEWVVCPECKSWDVSVFRDVGDRGGTEALNIDCAVCDTTTRVIP